MKPTRGARSHDNQSQCQVATAAIAASGKPVLYMLLSTILLALLCAMFARSFGPGAWSNPQHHYKTHQLSHAAQARSLMHI